MPTEDATVPLLPVLSLSCPIVGSLFLLPGLVTTTEKGGGVTEADETVADEACLSSATTVEFFLLTLLSSTRALFSSGTPDRSLGRRFEDAFPPPELPSMRRPVLVEPILIEERIFPIVFEDLWV